MADDPVSQSGTVSFSQSGTGTPPSAAATNPQASQLLSDLTGGVNQIEATINSIAQGGAKAVSGALADWQTKLKGIIQYTEDYEDSFKRLISMSKTFGETGFAKAKNYKELKSNLEDLLDTQKKLMKDGFFDKQAQRDLQMAMAVTNRSIKQVNDSMSETGKTMGDALDPDLVAQMTSGFRMMNSQIEKMGKNFNSIHLRPITQQAMQLNEAMGRSGLIEKYAKYAQIATRLEKLKTMNQNEGKGASRVNLDNLSGRTREMARAAGLLGAPRDKRIKGTRPAYFKDIARDISERAGGGGVVDRYLTQRALKQASDRGPDGKMGFLGRAMEASGGSVTRGIGQMGMNAAMGGVAEGAAGLARLAPILAIGELLVKFIDKNAEMNRTVAESLGEAGIFGGKGSGTSNLLAVRQSLGSAGMGFNFTGESYQKNLKIAQAIKEGGVNLPELAAGTRPGETSGLGMVKNIAYHGAKLAGFLDEGAATKEIMTVLQQYHESFTGVQDFFQHINRDTAAAGITTTKYIGIIDELNKQFDRMGASLEQTTNIMRVLGRTGVQSSEDVREALQAISNGGQKRGFEIQAFLGMRAASTGQTAGLVESQEGNITIAKKRAQEAISVLPGLDLGNLKSREDVGAAMDQLAQSSVGTPIERQAAMSSLKKLEQEMARGEAAHKVNALAGEGRYGEAGLAYASGQATLGRNLTGSTFEQFQAIRDQLKFSGAGSVGGLTSGKVDLTNPALVKITELLQSDPSVYMKLERVLRAQAQATTGLAASGALKDDTTYARLVNLASTIPGASDQLKLGDKSLTDRQRIIKLAKDNPKMFAKLTEKVASSDNLLDEILKTETGANEVAQMQLDKQDKQDQDDKAEQVATATRPLSEIFADAFENLFNTISQPLGWIVDFLARRFGDKVGQGETDRVRQEYTGDKIDELIGHVDQLKNDSKNNLHDIQKKLDDNPSLKDTDPTEYNKLQALKTQETNRQTSLGATFNDLVNYQRRATSTTGVVTQQDVMQADSVLTEAPKMAAAQAKALDAAHTQITDAQKQIDLDAAAKATKDQTTQQNKGDTSIVQTNITNIGANVSAHPIPPQATNQTQEGTPAIMTTDGVVVKK